jgi:transcriptional regulator with XRE-family HTH domain
MTMHTVGELLRQWRHRRRLSQLDLAIAADVSARHVSLVETGKSNPSADMVLRLADQLERVLRAHEPYPAVAFDRRWNIVMTNRAIEPFFADVDPDLLQPPINLVRLGLDPRGFAPLVVNLADVRVVFRSRIRRQLAVAPDAELTALYEELLEPKSEDPSSRSVESDVLIPMILRFNGRELRLFSTITTFGTPMDITLDEVAIESYYPADAESAAYFEEPNGDVRAAAYP